MTEEEKKMHERLNVGNYKIFADKKNIKEIKTIEDLFNLNVHTIFDIVRELCDLNSRGVKSLILKYYGGNYDISLGLIYAIIRSNNHKLHGVHLNDKPYLEQDAEIHYQDLYQLYYLIRDRGSNLVVNETNFFDMEPDEIYEEYKEKVLEANDFLCNYGNYFEEIKLED